MELFSHPDLSKTLITFGYAGIWTIVFAETGIVFGVLLPGDSLLFAAGMFAAEGYFDIRMMVLGCFLAALLGNGLGYFLGHRFGAPFLNRYGTRVTTPEKIERTHLFLKRYDRAGLIVSRFVPVARTFAPILAGTIRMNFLSFAFYSLIGAVVWGGGFPLLGYYFGGMLPTVVLHILTVGVILILLTWAILPFLRKKFISRRP